jgi:hypothetical protein
MSRNQIVAALTALGLSLCAAPAALAGTNSVGSSGGTPSANICVASFECTYINYRHGNPTDVVKRAGTLIDWSVNAGSSAGQVRLRVLRPIGHGRFKVRASSLVRTIANTGVNTFPAHLSVKAGDVLALTNSNSGIYMAAAPTGTCVRYFDAPLTGAGGKPNRTSTQLHLLLSAHIQH